MISMLAMAAMVSCTNEIETLDQPKVNENEPVEIVLNGGVNELTTKAAIQPGAAFTAQVIAIKNDATDYNTLLWGQANGNISIDTNGKVTFTNPQYYPADGSSIKMRGFAPQSSSITNGVVSYEINGTQDIMIAPEISADKTNNTNKKLEFAHLLTQLQIKVKAEDQAAIDAWGTITSISINAVKTLDLNLSTGKIAAKATDPVSADLSLEGFQTGQALTAVADDQAVSAGSIMLLPSKTAYKLKITTSKVTDKEIEISLAETLASNAHVITVTFKASEITVTATAGQWTTGTTGTGTAD